MTGDRVAADLVLASQSPRRRDLLSGLGLTFRTQAADVDESWSRGEDAVAYVERVARAKADAIAAQLDDRDATVVLAADTTVDLDGRILAKPDDDDHAREMLRSLSGRTHRVHTAVVGRVGEAVDSATVATDVVFARLTEPGIDWYLSLGEHRDKAGAYAMQGAGGALVVRIEGSPSNVIGLPLAETIGVLRACGLGAGPCS